MKPRVVLFAEEAPLPRGFLMERPPEVERLACSIPMPSGSRCNHPDIVALTPCTAAVDHARMDRSVTVPPHPKAGSIAVCS